MAPTPAPVNPLIEQLDISLHHKPFKNHAYKPPLRRNKNLRQMLSGGSGMDPAVVRGGGSGAASGATTPLQTTNTDPNRLNTLSLPVSIPMTNPAVMEAIQASGGSKGGGGGGGGGTNMPSSGKNAPGDNGCPATAIVAGIGGGMQPTYQNIESAPSFKRGRKLCDVTGMPANYTDPKTKLRYRDGEVFKTIRSLPPGAAERYLEVRGANVILK